MQDDATQRCEQIERYLAAYNAFDIEGMLAELGPQVRFENHSGGQLTTESDGIEAFRALAEQAKGLFSEREQRVVKLTPRDGGLHADIAWRGRLATDIPGWPPAGTLIEMQGQSEFSFTGGRISRIVDRS